MPISLNDASSFIVKLRILILRMQHFVRCCLLLCLSLVILSCSGSGSSDSTTGIDLELLSFGTDSSTTDLVIGEEYIFLLSIRNNGNELAPAAWQVTFTVSNDSITAPVLAVIPPGQTIVVSDVVTYTPDNADLGQQFITITIDSGDALNETNESNNSISRRYIISPASTN